MSADIPSRRLKATSHLARAAKTELGSADEAYHLKAATAEALVDIATYLAAIEKAVRHG
jgi:hypothetical protein